MSKVGQASSTAQTVSVALELLEVIARHDALTLSEVARRTGLSMNRTHRLLSTLDASGYLVRDRSKTYGLGPKLMYLGHRAARHDPLRQAASPVMDELAQQTGETIALAVRIGLERVLVDTRESQFSLQVSLSRNARLPLFVGALGRCLLAFAPPEVQESLLTGAFDGPSPQLLPAPDVLSELLAGIREEGIADIPKGASEFSIAAPVLGAGGFAIAALGISGPATRLDKEQDKRYRSLLRRASDTVTSQLPI